MKFLQFKDSNGRDSYVAVNMIIRYIALEPHKTEIVCRNGEKHIIPANTLALLSRICKDNQLDLIETAPDTDSHTPVVEEESDGVSGVEMEQVQR